MIITIEISVEEIFNQTVDQTLYDFKRNPKTGEPTAGRLALSKEDFDIFLVNLKTVVDNIYSGSLNKVKAFEFGEESVRALIEVNSKINPEVIASRFKDLMKYGVLCWWNSTKDIGLYQIYKTEYDNLFSKLKSQLIGSITTRPYIIVNQ